MFGYTKYQGSSRFLQEFFQDFHIFLNQYKSDMLPGRAPFYTRGILWTFFLATNQNHFKKFGRGPGIIPDEFGQIPISVAQEKKSLKLFLI